MRIETIDFHNLYTTDSKLNENSQKYRGIDRACEALDISKTANLS